MSGRRLSASTGAPRRPGSTTVALVTFAPCKDTRRTAATSSRTWPHRSMSPPLRTFGGRTANTSTTGQTSTWWRALWPTVCSQEADRAVASLTTSWWARCPRSGAMPAALGAGQIPWCSVTLRSCAEQGSVSSKERTVSSSRTRFRRRPFSGSSARTTSAGPTRRSWPRSARTACCTSCGTFGLRPLRPRPQPWTTAGSADVAGPAAPGEGAGSRH